MSQAKAVEDTRQLALSDAGMADRQYIKEQLGLRDLQDAYRLAVAVALAKNLPPAPADTHRSTTAGAHVLDSDGSLRASVMLMRDDHDGRPYALIERLAEAGLRDLAEHLNEGLPIRQYLAAVLPPGEAQN